MAEMNSHKIPASIRVHVEGLVGQMCSLRQIYKDRSLKLGFGEVVLRKSARMETKHAIWEIGTYYRSWRIIHGQRIVCGSQDAVDDIDELRQKMNGIEWGHCSAIRHLTDFDVRMEFDNGVFVDFLATISSDDEILHLICPDHIAVKFSIAEGWRVGPSDKPWPNNAGTGKLRGT